MTYEVLLPTQRIYCITTTNDSNIRIFESLGLEFFILYFPFCEILVGT